MEVSLDSQACLKIVTVRRLEPSIGYLQDTWGHRWCLQPGRPWSASQPPGCKPAFSKQFSSLLSCIGISKPPNWIPKFPNGTLSMDRCQIIVVGGGIHVKDILLGHLADVILDFYSNKKRFFVIGTQMVLWP